MSLNTEQIELLVFKFNNGTIQPDELQVLTDWYNSHDDEKVSIPSKKDETVDEVKSRILAGLLAKISHEKAPAKRFGKIGWIITTAAAVLIAIGTWVVVDKTIRVEDAKVVRSGIEPGGNKATLTLADGRTIELSTSQEGIVAGEEITYSNGSPVGNVALDELGDSNELLSMHTPRGGTYKITLSDGTQVWLNAATTIKYPLKFAAQERVVELEGEAYFHVKPAYGEDGKRIPFSVKSKRHKVEVLGTQFNISTYPEQASDKTTLVEGRVIVEDNLNRFTLVPNQQAVTGSSGTTVKTVNINHFTAWKDGKFSFDGKTFQETMNEIGRWYDLDIVYEKGVPNEELIGDAFRNQNIGFVLRLLEVAEIDYKLDVNRSVLTIIGKKKKNLSPKPN